ncbi:medium chain dehydrogenase/reductase family protein [Granulicella arctica]|uniref:medium chain dehydrogenase/reductase family protein n=1 Tax=Granulicella arctica TaxID=940613 RepID=UPI0021E039EF|nr:medium chain dehydrogenase/reductase family protein [Granulicella arctica]
METTIRKVLVPHFGDESVLQIIEATVASPQVGEVQVQVLHSVVAGSDVNMRRGLYPFQKKAPLTPGYSMIGRALANGPGCKKFAPGTLVACLTIYGSQAERMNVPEKFVSPVPEGLDLRQATALILDWMTAYEMLEHSAHVKRGQRIFVHGLSGAVGTALLHLAHLRGAEVFGTASVSKHAELSAADAVVFDYRQKDWIQQMQRLGGVDSVFDPLGYQSFDESYSILRKGGLLVGYGQNLPALSNGPRPSPLPMILKLFARNLAFWSGKRTTFFGLFRGSKHFAPDLACLFRMLGEGRIRVPIKAVFPLADVQEAHRTYARGSGVGSIILDVA